MYVYEIRHYKKKENMSVQMLKKYSKMSDNGLFMSVWYIQSVYAHFESHLLTDAFEPFIFLKYLCLQKKSKALVYNTQLRQTFVWHKSRMCNQTKWATLLRKSDSNHLFPPHGFSIEVVPCPLRWCWEFASCDGGPSASSRSAGVELQLLPGEAQLSRRR